LNKYHQPLTSSGKPEGLANNKGHIQWSVGLDIGAMYSGFAYANGPHVHQMHVNYDYPYAEKPYYKAFMYYKLKDPATISHYESWGYLIEQQYLENVQGSQQGIKDPYMCQKSTYLIQ
jgi:hypothetical protein